MIIVPQVMCWGLPNSRSANGVGPLMLCPKFCRATKLKEKKSGRLKFVTWNIGKMTGRNARDTKKKKVNITCAQGIK